MPITFLDDKKEQPGNGITFLDNADSAGISFLDAGRNATGEEVTNRQASNPASAELMNRDDYVRMLEYKRDNPVSWGTIAINGAVGLADVAVGTIKELGGATLDAFNAPAPKGSISQLGVADLSRLNPVGEVAARGAYAGFNQLAGMALDMMTFNDDDLISYPQYLSANNLSDSAENKQKHEFELNKQFEEFKRSQFAKAQTKDILEKSPLPATSEAVSLFAQPEFGMGALMAKIGMGAKLGRAVADIGSVAGEATQKLGKGLTTLSEMPKKLAVATAEELTGNPRVASRVGGAVQTGTTGAVIAGMGGFAIPGVYEASKLITATKIAGEVLDVAGEVTKKISEFAKAGTGRIGAFENLANDLTASSSARTIGKIATLGGVDSITPYMSAALQGAAGGAVVGGTLGFLADGGEGMAAGVGMGLTLGAGGGLAGRGLQAASGAQRRSQIINDATKGVLNLSGTSQVNAAKLFDSLIRRDGQEAVAELIDTTKWLNGAVKFEYITNEQAKSMPEARGVGFEGITVAPKKGETGTPTVFINVDLFNPGTGFHEGFHGAMRTALGDIYAPKFNELISKSFSQKEIDDFVSSYIDRAEDPAVKNVLKLYLEEKGTLPEEIGAEYFRQFLQKRENRDILLRGQRTTSGALLNATKSAIDFSLNRLGVTQESYKTGYKGMDRLVTELIGARTAINKSIAKNGVPLAEVPLMKMPAEQVAAWAKEQGQSDVLLKDDAGNVIGVKTEDQVNLQRDLANTKAAADLADVPRGKNNLTDAELAVYQKYLSPDHFARLVYIVDAIKTGKVINGDYFPATSKEGETAVYASRGMTTRDFVPYGIKVSKSGAISVMGLDLTQLRARFDDYMSRPGVDKLWDGNRDAALMDVQRYAENLSKGDAAVPSEQLFGKNKRDVLYKIFGFAPTKAILKGGGLVNPSSLGTNVRAESSAGPMQIGKPIDAYSNDTRLTTSFRLDRLGRVSDIGQSFQFNEGGSYKLSQVNFQVAEKIGSGEVWRSKDDQYKIIVNGNKHIVYNGNDKIGIFGNLADASSHIHKAEAKTIKNAPHGISPIDPAQAKSISDGSTQHLNDGNLLATVNFMPDSPEVKRLMREFPLDEAAKKKMLGKTGFAFASDWADSNRKYVTSGGREIDLMVGGFGYTYHPEVIGKGAWAGTFSTITNRVVDNINKTDGIGLVVLGGKESSASSRAFSLAFIAEIQDAIAAKQLKRKDADRLIAKTFSDLNRPEIKTLDDYAILAPKEKNIENPGGLTFEDRQLAVQAIGSAINSRKLALPNWNDVMRNYNVQKGDYQPGQIVSVIQFNKGKSAVRSQVAGTKNHPSYEAVLPGKPIGVLTQKVMIADFFKDFFASEGTQTRDFTRKVQTKMPEFKYGEGSSVLEGRPINEVNFMPSETPESKFYSSRIISAVENSSQGKANGSQWKATIRNSKLGVNQDEYALTRVEDLEAGKTYTKAEVLDYLRANEVVVKDVTLGDKSEPVQMVRFRDLPATVDKRQIPGQEQMSPNDWIALVNGEYAGTGDESLTKAEARENIDMDRSDAGIGAAGQKTHFQNYTLPGAVEGSYREVLLTVPATPKISRSREMTYGDIPAGATTQEFFALRERALAGEKLKYTEEGETWRDGHDQYDNIPNPIVRLRTNERTILTYTPEQIADIGRRLVSSIGANSENSLGSGAPQFGVNKGAITPLEAAQYSHAKKYTSGVDQKGAVQRMLFLEEIQAPQKGQFEKMPTLFQKNWRDIAFKWALRTAADNGFDSVGWTTGEQQAARYDLSKQIDSIFAEKLTDGTKAGQYSLQVSGENGTQHLVIPEAKLEENIGKELAKRIVEEADTFPDGKKYSGLDLKVGGEGLKKLYDQDFRNVVNNLPVVKKSGQKVGMTGISADKKGWHLTPPNQTTHGGWMVKNADYNSQGTRFSPTTEGEAKARAFLAERLNDSNAEVHSINITPEMRNASVSFMPAIKFSAPENLPNGKVWRGENGYAIIQKEGGKFRVHSPIGLIGIASSYEAAEKMASKRNNK